MPSIEYSPTSRASCRGCFSKIKKGTVRVGVRRSSSGCGGGRYSNMEFHTEYYHAKCYTGRTDFTKFYGWSCIRKTDQRQLGFGPKLDKDATPIASLSLEQHGNCSSSSTSGRRWKIVARVTAKSDIRTFSNFRGDGKLFSIELLDASGMDIRATLFNQAVDEFYDKLVVGQVYEIADAATLKAANAQYNTCQSPLEMTLNEHSHIEPASAVHNTRIAVPFELVPLAQIVEQQQPSSLEAGSNHHQKKVDVLAMVATVSEIESITKENNGTKLEKREIVLVDNSSNSNSSSDNSSSTSISWTLWGKQAAATVAPKVGTVVVIRHSHVREFLGQPTLSGAAHWECVDLVTNAHQQQLSGTSMLPDHVRTQAQQLQQWWDTNEASDHQAATHATKEEDKVMETEQEEATKPPAVEDKTQEALSVESKQDETPPKEEQPAAAAASDDSEPQGDDVEAKQAPGEEQKTEITPEQENTSKTDDSKDESKTNETTMAEVAPVTVSSESESNPIVQEEESSSSKPLVAPTETKQPNASSSNETTTTVTDDKTSSSPTKRKLEEQATLPEQPVEKQMKTATTTTPQETSNKENAAQITA